MCCPRSPLATASQLSVVRHDFLFDDVASIVLDGLPFLLPLAPAIQAVSRLNPFQDFLEVNGSLPYFNYSGSVSLVSFRSP